jgi:hypothetical protein
MLDGGDDYKGGRCFGTSNSAPQIRNEKRYPVLMHNLEGTRSGFMIIQPHPYIFTHRGHDFMRGVIALEFDVLSAQPQSLWIIGNA